MRPIRLLLVLLLLTMLVAATPAGAQPNPRVEELVLVAPSDGALVDTVTVMFVWEPTMSAEYNFKLFSADKTQVVKADVDPDICAAFCSYLFDPAAHSWTWRNATTYIWQVKSRDGIGNVNVKSEKRSFTTDLLATIVLVSPTDGANVSIPIFGLKSVPFMWSEGDYDKFRLVVSKANGKVFEEIVWLADTPCSGGQCSYTIDMDGIGRDKTKAFTWKVLGKRDNVAGKGKSEKWDFTATGTLE
jgi:hypothetical protein